MKIIQATITYILLSITVIITYSIATATGLLLAIGGTLNYPLLWTIGKLNGRQTIQRQTQQNR